MLPGAPALLALQQFLHSHIQECKEACKVLGTKPLFVGQVDGESVLGNPELAKFEQLLYAEKPDIVFAHWPVDSHKDHQLSSVLTMQSWME